VSPALFILASALSFAAPDAPAQDTAVFAPAFCPYAVQFPDAITATAAQAGDGSKIAAVEQVIGGMRLSAFCAVSADPVSDTVLDPVERGLRIRALVNSLQIGDAAINDVGLSAPDCSEVHGTMLVNTISYKIVARLCMRADSTFIAEAIFAQGSDEASASAFIAGVKRTALTADAGP
jgi:hypothetical protein